MSCDLNKIKADSIASAMNMVTEKISDFERIETNLISIPVTRENKITIYNECIKASQRISRWAENTFGEKFSEGWMTVKQMPNSTLVLVTFPKNLEQAYKVKQGIQSLEDANRDLIYIRSKNEFIVHGEVYPTYEDAQRAVLSPTDEEADRMNRESAELEKQNAQKEFPENMIKIEEPITDVEEEITTPTTKEVKPGVQELFESNPELASIGTPEQYSQYLDTIFPDSKVKDIVYRGGEGGISKEQYYTLQKEYAERYGKVVPAILNLENPIISDRGIHRSWVNEEITDRGLIGKDYPGSTSDAVIEQMNGDIPFSAKGNFDVYVIKNENQKHILGSKQDIEGFKKFVEKPEEGEKIMFSIESTKFLKDLESKLINGFLKDFNITVTEYESLKDDLGIDSYTASDLVSKAIAYEKGESITPEVAYFAFSMLGKQNNKIRSQLRFLISKWDKYRDRFQYHKQLLEQQEGFISDKKEWKNKVRDQVIIDFLREKLEQHYTNPQEFEKSLDTKWTKEDFSIWNKIIFFLEDLLSRFSSKYKSQSQQLKNIGISIANEVLSRNYEYFNYNLSEDQVKKYYQETLDKNPKAAEIQSVGREIGMIATGSIVLRKAGDLYRSESEEVHDSDFIVPYDLSNKQPDVVKRLWGNREHINAGMTDGVQIAEKFEWYKEFVSKYPTFKAFNSFMSSEKESVGKGTFTIQGVINGEFYDSFGFHTENYKYYAKDPVTKQPIERKGKRIKFHKPGDWIKDTGELVDFFVRLFPKQEEHENYFLTWKQIMAAKLDMARDKDFIDWRYFIPYIESKNEFNFSYEGFRHVNHESFEKYASDKAKSELQLNLSEQAEKLSQLSNNKWFSQTIQPIINKFAEMFPTIRVRVISETEIPAEVRKKVDALGKQVNSFYHKGQVYLIKERITKDVTIEEFLHPFINVLEKENPELYKSLLAEAKKAFPALKDKIFKEYEKVYDSVFDLNREFLTQALTQKVSENMPEEQVSVLQRFLNYLRGLLDRLFEGKEKMYYNMNVADLDLDTSLNELAAILTTKDVKFEFEDTSTAVSYSLSSEDMNYYQSLPKTPIQQETFDKVVANNAKFDLITQDEQGNPVHQYKFLDLFMTEPEDCISVSEKIFGKNFDSKFEDFAYFGTLVHELLKKLNTQANLSEADLTSIIEESKLKGFFEGDPEVTRQIANYIKDYLVRLKGNESILISEVTLGEDFARGAGEEARERIAGTIDLLEITKDGKKIIHDFKTKFLGVKFKDEITREAFNAELNKDKFKKQQSAYAKLLDVAGIANYEDVELQIVPIGVKGTTVTLRDELTGEDYITYTIDKDEKGNPILYFPIRFNENYGIDRNSYKLEKLTRTEANKIIGTPFTSEAKTTKSKKELDEEKAKSYITQELRGENSKKFEKDIQGIFTLLYNTVSQYGRSVKDLRRELYKFFEDTDEKTFSKIKDDMEIMLERIEQIAKEQTELDKTSEEYANLEAEKVKQYLATVTQYINFIEENSIGIRNLRDNFDLTIANKGNLTEYELLDRVRNMYVLAISNKEQLGATMDQLKELGEDNVLIKMLDRSLKDIDYIERQYVERTIPILASIMARQFTPKSIEIMTNELNDRVKSVQYRLDNETMSKYEKKYWEKQLATYKKQLEILPTEEVLAKMIRGEMGDADWFYSNLVANINNPDYIIAASANILERALIDLRHVSIPIQEEFGAQQAKRLGVFADNRDQSKKLNEDLTYEVQVLLTDKDGNDEIFKTLTFVTDVNENVYFDYEMLKREYDKAKEEDKPAIKARIKAFEDEHFETKYTSDYQTVLDEINVEVSDGRNVKEVLDNAYEAISYIRRKNGEKKFKQGLLNEDDLRDLREAQRNYNNLFSRIDRDGNPKTGADLEIYSILSNRRERLEVFRNKVPQTAVWNRYRSAKISELLSKYNTEEEVLNSPEFKEWQSFNSRIRPKQEFYDKRKALYDKVSQILSKRQYSGDPNVRENLQDLKSDAWNQLNAILREYRDFEGEVMTSEMNENARRAATQLEESINEIQSKISELVKGGTLSEEDKKELSKTFEEINSLSTYETTKYYEEDYNHALNEYSAKLGITIEELRSDKSLMAQFRLENEWYKNNHIVVKVYNRELGETINQIQPASYYRIIVPKDLSYVEEQPAAQYNSYEVKPEYINAKYQDKYGRRGVKENSAYRTSKNTKWVKWKNGLTEKDRINYANATFIKNSLDEVQLGKNLDKPIYRGNMVIYAVPSQRKGSYERIMEGKPQDIIKNVKESASKTLQDNEEFGTRTVLADVNGEESKFVRVLYTNKINIEDISYDVFGSTMKYILSVKKAQMMEEKVSTFEVLQDALEESGVKDPNVVNAISAKLSEKIGSKTTPLKSTKNERLDSIRDLVGRIIYEEYKKDMLNIPGLNISDSKAVDTILGYAGANMMFGNIPNWIVNYFSGNIQIMIEAAAGRNFGRTEVASAKKEIGSLAKDIVSDMGKVHDKSLIGQLIDYFDPIKGEFMDEFGNKMDWSLRRNLKSIFFSGKIFGEWEMQMTTFIAMLKAKKVIQLVDGVEKTISLYDAWEKGKDGIPKLKEGVQISEEELKDYMQRIQGINKALNGSYAKIDQTKLEKYSLARFAIFMKKFFIPLLINRWGGFRYDMEMKDNREGHYRLFLKTAMADLINYRGNIAKVYANFNKPVEEGGYTEMQKQAITKTFNEMLFIGGLFLLLALLGYGDDEPDDDKTKFAQYLLLKIRRETTTFAPPIALNETVSIFTRPFAAMGAVGNVTNLMYMAFVQYPLNLTTGAFENDLYYQRNTALFDKGDSKFLAILYKVLGLKLNIKEPEQLLQGYNYSVRW